MQHAVVTGGTGGLGGAIVAGLKADGWRVDSLGREALDLRDLPAVERYFSGRRVDLLVCAAGITRDALLHRLEEEAWDEVWRINFEAAAACAKAAIRSMVGQGGGGHVIFISSYSAIHPPAGQAAYAAAKAALLGLTRDLAAGNGCHDIRVNVILPGFLETPMTSTVTGVRRARVLEDHRLGRFNTPEAVAAFIRHLHGHLPHTSGQVFQLDSRFP